MTGSHLPQPPTHQVSPREGINEGVELVRPEPSHQSLDVQDILQWYARLIFGRRLIEGLEEPLLRQAGYFAVGSLNLCIDLI